MAFVGHAKVPSRVAAAAIWLSRFIPGNDTKWVRDICLLHLDHVDNTIGSQTANLAHYSLYADIQTCPEAESNVVKCVEPIPWGPVSKVHPTCLN